MAKLRTSILRNLTALERTDLSEVHAMLHNDRPTATRPQKYDDLMKFARTWDRAPELAQVNEALVRLTKRRRTQGPN